MLVVEKSEKLIEMTRLLMRFIEEFRKSKKEFRSFDPSYQERVIKVRIYCLAWFTFILTSAGIFICSTPYMDRKRLERGDVLEYRSPKDTSSLFYSFISRRQNNVEIPSPEEYVESLKKKS